MKNALFPYEKVRRGPISPLGTAAGMAAQARSAQGG
jgi:hypothetical protein